MALIKKIRCHCPLLSTSPRWNNSKDTS